MWPQPTTTTKPLQTTAPPRRGFSLIELLVVIGIITILISMLMPAMASVRARGEELKCQATLRSIGIAAAMHVNDHSGYLPVAGWHWDLPGGVCNPKALGDESARRYIYYSDESEQRPVPITVALALGLGTKVRLDSREHLEDDLEKPALRRLFHCPSQEEELLGWSQREMNAGGWTAPAESSSYVFNEALLGRRGQPEPSPMGRLTVVRQPSIVFFAMDGRPRDRGQDKWIMIFDGSPDWTLYEYRQHIQTWNGGKDTFDYTRHRYRMNVLFLDWHVESVPMTDAGLQTVGVSKGIYR